MVGEKSNQVQYFADLHIHSFWSDGSCAPKEIVKRAAAHNLAFICLTDVMNLGGWKEFHQACLKYDLDSVPSLELQTYHGKDWVELLLYGEGITHESFLPYIQQAFHATEVVSLLYLGYLRSRGITVSKGEVDQHFRIPTNRTHSLYRINEYLRRVRNIPNEEIGRLIQAANLRHIDRPDIYREYLPSLEDVLRISKKLNIVSCFAYPGVTAERRGKMKGNSRAKELENIMDEAWALKPLGLRAIEVRYPEHSAEEERALYRFATDNHFIPIGGSGFHGDLASEHKPGLTLGIRGLTQSEYESFRNELRGLR